MFPVPTAPAWSRCARCWKPTRTERLVHGFGRDCAERLGLIVPAPRVHAAAQSGPSLLDSLVEDDGCDGWDRPADRPSGR